LNELIFSKTLFSVQVIAKFLALMYSYLNISISKNFVPDEVKGREIHYSFPLTLFQVIFFGSVTQMQNTLPLAF